jgi:TPP-dependent 2-oxoacid decarboxylase
MKTRKILVKNKKTKKQKKMYIQTISAQVKNKNIGYFISKMLLENGIDTFFGVPSDLNMPFLDAVKPYIKFIPFRNELNASYASEGFARTKRFSLLVVGGMVGSFSAINGFSNGISEKNPILMIAGGNNFNDENEGKLSHHTLFKDNNDQMATYKCFLALGGQENTFNIENNDSLNTPNMINLFNNISTSLVAFNSVFLQIPVNSQKHNTNLEDFTDIVSNKFKCEIQTYEQYTLYTIITKWLNELFQSDFEKIKDLKPVFLIGSEYKQYLKYIEIADERFYKLMEHINASIFYTIDAKGILDESNKNVIGYYWGGITEDKKLDYFRQSKALFYIGVELSDYTSSGYSALFKPHYTFNCKNISTKNTFNKKLANKYYFNKTSINISKIISNNMTLNTDLFVETGSSWFYGSQVKLPKGARYNISIRYGSIGWCFPASIGNAFANPHRKTICLTGDGALQCVIQEISTAATYNVNLTVILINNNVYQIENVLDKEDYNKLPEYDYEKLAKSICCKDVVNCDINSFEKALKKSVSKKGFSIVVLKISKNDIDNLMNNWASLVSNYTTHCI